MFFCCILVLRLNVFAFSYIFLNAEVLAEFPQPFCQLQLFWTLSAKAFHHQIDQDPNFFPILMKIYGCRSWSLSWFYAFIAPTLVLIIAWKRQVFSFFLISDMCLDILTFEDEQESPSSSLNLLLVSPYSKSLKVIRQIKHLPDHPRTHLGLGVGLEKMQNLTTWNLIEIKKWNMISRLP